MNIYFRTGLLLNLTAGSKDWRRASLQRQQSQGRSLVRLNLVLAAARGTIRIETKLGQYAISPNGIDMKDKIYFYRFKNRYGS